MIHFVKTHHTSWCILKVGAVVNHFINRLWTNCLKFDFFSCDQFEYLLIDWSFSKLLLLSVIIMLITVKIWLWISIIGWWIRTLSVEKCSVLCAQKSPKRVTNTVKPKYVFIVIFKTLHVLCLGCWLKEFLNIKTPFFFTTNCRIIITFLFCTYSTNKLCRIFETLLLKRAENIRDTYRGTYTYATIVSENL